MKQLGDNLGALEVELTAEDLAAIDNLSAPGTNVAEYYEARFRPNEHHF